MAAPDAALVTRFRADFAGALGRPVAAGEVVALAVSGGPDSMAMLALAAAAWPGQVTAATVDHGLRLASRDEAAMVGDYCITIGAAHAVLHPAVPLDGPNLHARAREVRYALLARWAVGQDARVLATAHHVDDQAETFLMRAARGSGVAGLSGVRARQRRDVSFPAGKTGMVFDVFDLDVVRPLLGWRRSDLRALAQSAGVPFVDDPGNADPRYDRTAMRALLAREPMLDPVQIARAAAHAADADAALRSIESWLWRQRKRQPTGIDDPDAEIWLDLSGLPREVKRRLVRAAITDVRLVNGITRPDWTDSHNVEPLLDALEAGKAATQAGVMVRPAPEVWRFSEAPPRRSPASP